MTGLDTFSVKRAYSRWANVYDWVYGPFFTAARRRAIELMELEEGARAVEVGVGTGLSLPLFPAHCQVVGVDFSRPMLQRAATRLRELQIAAQLVEGDGARLPFADRSFDGALAPYVVSAAPDPVALLREMQRVCRPGSPLVTLNHFTAPRPVGAAVERAVSRFTSKVLGFRTDFPLRALFADAGLRVEHLERVSPLRYWHIVVCKAQDGRGDPGRGELGQTPMAEDRGVTGEQLTR